MYCMLVCMHACLHACKGKAYMSMHVSVQIYLGTVDLPDLFIHSDTNCACEYVLAVSVMQASTCMHIPNHIRDPPLLLGPDIPA